MTRFTVSASWTSVARVMVGVLAAASLMLGSVSVGAAEAHRESAYSDAVGILLSVGPNRPAEVSDAALISDLVGYQSQIRDGYLENPNGRCSSPVSLPAAFEPMCRRHDLGYDLLRSADQNGSALPPSSRKALDRRFIGNITALCKAEESAWSQRYCFGIAQIVGLAVRANSLRQFDGPPRQENWPWQWD